MNSALLALCNDLDFDSTSYELREDRYLKVYSDPSIWFDTNNGTLHFQNFTLIALTNHLKVKKSLSWTIEISRKRGYWVDLVNIRERATELDDEYNLTSKVSFNRIVEHLALNDLLARQKVFVSLEKRKGKPFLCVYKAETLLNIFPLSLIELAWLAKL